MADTAAGGALPPQSEFAHATAVAVRRRGVLLLGPSGAGKSDLALRLIDAGARLVADDQVVLSRDGERLLASAPPALAGRLEVRGIGILHLDGSRLWRRMPLALAVELASPEHIERLPEPATRSFLGLALPLVRLAPFEASAGAQLQPAPGGRAGG